MSDETKQAETDVSCKVLGKVDGAIEKVCGLIGNRPWEQWLAFANKWVIKLMPLFIVVAGACSILAVTATYIHCDAPVSLVLRSLAMSIFTIFLSVLLAPKALHLVQSVAGKGESMTVRPEILYILKIVTGFCSLVAAVCLLVQFDKNLLALALFGIVFGVMMLIVTMRPQIVGLKAGHPTNGCEELISLIFVPIRIVLTFLTVLTASTMIGAFLGGLVRWVDSGLLAAEMFDISVIAPLYVPLALYLFYLLITFVLDFYRAIVSIPRKLDELKDSQK